MAQLIVSEHGDRPGVGHGAAVREQPVTGGGQSGYGRCVAGGGRRVVERGQVRGAEHGAEHRGAIERAGQVLVGPRVGPAAVPGPTQVPVAGVARRGRDRRAGDRGPVNVEAEPGRRERRGDEVPRPVVHRDRALELGLGEKALLDPEGNDARGFPPRASGPGSSTRCRAGRWRTR